MYEEIESTIAFRRRQYQWTSWILLIAATAMTYGFFSKGDYNDLVVGVAMAMFWCLFVQSIETTRTLSLLSQLLEKMKH